MAKDPNYDRYAGIVSLPGPDSKLPPPSGSMRTGTSDGMIDKWDPSRDLYGDIESLRGGNPVPMATVSEGRIGWHQLEDGRLQFMYPVGSYSGSKKDQEEEQKMIKIIQENLDRQQSLFYRK